MAKRKVARSRVELLAAILDSPETQELIDELDDLYVTGRRGYSNRARVGMMLAERVFNLPTTTRTVDLVSDHAGLHAMLANTEGKVPSLDACYRFFKKLVRKLPLIERHLERVLRMLHEFYPEMGKDIAIDGTSIRAHANGQKRKTKNGPERPPEDFSDPDADWVTAGSTGTEGSRRSIYGHKVHLAVCTRTDLPLVCDVDTAAGERDKVAPFIDAIRACGFAAETIAADQGYDGREVHAACIESDCIPIIPLPASTVRTGSAENPRCPHGPMTSGIERKRRVLKWKCREGICNSIRVKASREQPLIPYKSRSWKKLYAARSAVERENGRLKHEWGLDAVRVRGRDRVQLHARLSMFARLASALAGVRLTAAPS